MAGIIKADGNNGSHTAQSTMPYHFDDIASKASAHLETVKAQARQILERAQQQAVQLMAQAEVRGQEAAMAAAYQRVQAEFEQKVATLLPALQQAIQGIQDTKQGWIRKWEHEAIRLAAAIAERIIRRELSQQPQISQQWIREALEMGASRGQVRLLLNPEDYKAFEGKADAFLSELGELAPATIGPDASVSPGGCRVVTSHGEIDQRLETQLKRIQEELS